MMVNVSWRGLDVTNVNGSLWQSEVHGRLKQSTVSECCGEKGRSKEE